jgi:hypothetical protein
MVFFITACLLVDCWLTAGDRLLVTSGQIARVSIKAAVRLFTFAINAPVAQLDRVLASEVNTNCVCDN